MIQRNKWIHDASLSENAAKVARRVIRQRLETIGDYLPHAANLDRNPVEDIHQLRVACRRGEAALLVFSNLIRKKRRVKLHQRIVRIRHAAGQARDLDILNDQIVRADEFNGLEGEWDGLRRMIRRHREREQKPIRRAHRRWDRRFSARSIRGRLGKTFWRRRAENIEFGDLSHLAIQQRVDEFFRRGEKIDDLKGLHALRKSGKRLRYSIELLSSAFHASMRNEIYDSFVEVQNRLGILNDHAVTADMAEQWTQRCDGQIAGKLREMTRHRRDQLGRHCSEFRQWWTRQRASQLRLLFDEVIQPRRASSSRIGAWKNGPR